MLVAIVTDSPQVPVELVYFLLGAGHGSDLFVRSDGAAPSAPAGDYFVADTHAKGLEPLDWISELPAARSAVMLREANHALRKALRSARFETILQYPGQLKDLGDVLRAAVLTSRTERLQLTQARFSLGDIELDVAARRLVSPKMTLPLTMTEAKVLAYLAQNATRAVSRHQIEVVCGSIQFTDSTRRIDVLVSGLRTKLARVGAAARIDSVRGVGYQMSGEWLPGLETAASEAT